LLAIYATASSPDEHILLMAKAVAESGNPARYIAILTYITPEPGYKTLPIITSSTLDGSNLVLSITFFNNGAIIYSTAVSFKAPIIRYIILNYHYKGEYFYIIYSKNTS